MFICEAFQMSSTPFDGMNVYKMEKHSLPFSPVFLVALYRSWRCWPVLSLCSPVVWPEGGEEEKEKKVKKKNQFSKKGRI